MLLSILALMVKLELNATTSSHSDMERIKFLIVACSSDYILNGGRGEKKSYEFVDEIRGEK
jgi:hypothetical protein